MRRSLAVLFVATGLLLSGFCAVAQAVPGGLDRSFGELPGRTTLDGPRSEKNRTPASSITLGDGSTVWIGSRYYERSILTKHRPDGSQATEFGDRGTVLLPLVGKKAYFGWGLARQDDSIITLSYGSDDAQRSVSLERRDGITGERDPSFGTGGVVGFDFSDKLATYRDPYPMMLDVDPAGRIYVAASDGSFNSDRAVVRFTPDGKLDKSWAKSGVLTIHQSGCQRSPTGISLTPLGLYAYYDDCYRRYDETGTLDQTFGLNENFFFGHSGLVLPGPASTIYIALTRDNGSVQSVVRVNENGTVDTSFGDNGRVTPEIGDEEVGNLAVDQAHRVILTGGADPEELDPNIEVLRFTTNGDPDPSFGTAGVASFDSGGEESARPVASPVPGGLVLRAGGVATRLDEGGVPDPSFGSGGTLEFTAFMPPEDRVLDTITLPGGGTLAAGLSDGQAAFARFKPNGKIDSGFGEGGLLTVPSTTIDRQDKATYVSPSTDGSFVACLDTPVGVVVAKLRPGGSLDPDFGNDGTVRVTGMTRCGGIGAVADGTLVGGVWNQNYVVLRLTPDGKWDKTYGKDGWAWGPEANWYQPKLTFTTYPDGSSLVSSSREIAKFKADGTPDRKFSRDGSTKLPEADMRFPMSILVNKKGQIYVGGRGSSNPVIYRLTASGRWDRNFGFRSVRVLRNPKSSVRPTDFKLQRDGKLVFVATARSRECRVDCGKIWLYRLKADGSFDRKFGKRGVAEARFGANTTGDSVSLSRKGIVVGGLAETGEGFDDMLLARFKR